MPAAKKPTAAKPIARKPRSVRSGGKTYLKARHAFGVSYDGAFITVSEGELVPVGHKLLKQLGKAGVEEHFEPVTSFGRWDKVETATAAPGEQR